METYKCFYCSFAFNETEKEWDVATKTKQCPRCRKVLHDFPPGKQQKAAQAVPTIAEYRKQSSGLEQQEQTFTKPAADYEIALIAIPVLGTMLIWFWVSGMNLLQSPSNSIELILIGTIASTAIVAAMEASNVGVKHDKGYSPIAWFFSFVVMWAIAYPLYLYKRKYYGLANRMAAGIIVMLIFIGSFAVMFTAIEMKKAEVRGNLGQLQSNLKNLITPFEHSNLAAPKPNPEELAQKSKQQEVATDAMPADLYFYTPGDVTIVTDGTDFRLKSLNKVGSEVFATKQEAIDYIYEMHKIMNPGEGKNYQPVGVVAPKPNLEVDAQKASLTLKKQNEDTVEKARLVSEAPSGEYVSIGSDDSGKEFAYLPSSIQKSGNNSIMWTLTIYKNIVQQGNISYISTKQKDEFDCQSKKFRNIGIIAYDAPTGNGNIVSSNYTNEKFISINPGTVADNQWSIACQRQ